MSTDLQVSDNPYDPDTQDYATVTPPLDQLIEMGMRKLALELNVWRPVKVTKKKGNGRVNLQVLLQAKYIKSSAPVSLPEIQDALVCYPRGKNYSMRPPIKEGDTGIALFCDRSLDAWSVQGGEVLPNDPRTHNLSDAVFIPGLYPFSDQIDDDTDDFTFSNGDSQIRLKADGSFLIGGKGATSPLVLGDVLKDALSSLESALDNLRSGTDILNTGTIAFVTACTSSVTDPILQAAATSYVPVVSAYTGVLAAFAASLALFKAQYLDTDATNILSQKSFTERSTG